MWQEFCLICCVRAFVLYLAPLLVLVICVAISQFPSCDFYCEIHSSWQLPET